MALMLLYWSRAFDAGHSGNPAGAEGLVDVACDLPLQASADLARLYVIGGSPLDVILGWQVMSQADKCDAVKGGACSTVAAAIEAMAARLTA